MTSTTDYTPILLAQLTDLQARVTKQDAVITSLVAAVERLSGQTFNVGDTMRTSVPLRSHDSADIATKRVRPQVARSPILSQGPKQRPTMGRDVRDVRDVHDVLYDLVKS